jgi:ankyrin repeat protein
LRPRNALRAIGAAWLLAVAISASGQALDQFFKAVNDGDAKTVATLLSLGLDPNTPDATGSTPLMTAARLGHLELASLLIARKADIARRSSHGDTALMFASLKGHLTVVQLLVDKGAPVVQDGWAPLHYAAFEGRADVIKYLIGKQADKNALGPNGYSPLMLAVRSGHLEAVRTLLYEDADLKIKGPAGETALGIAMAKKNGELEALLRRAGAVE